MRSLMGPELYLDTDIPILSGTLFYLNNQPIIQASFHAKPNSVYYVIQIPLVTSFKSMGKLRKHLYYLLHFKLP